MDPELSKETVNMRLDGALGDEQHAANLGVGKAFAYECVDLLLASRERFDGVNDCGSRQTKRGEQRVVTGAADDE